MNMHQPASKHPWPIAPARVATQVDPIVLQIIEGTLNSIEAEIEYAIERTARSPMIREAHDYRVGLFDRYCRKLTGRSYSAMPNAVVRDFPPETMRPGDVFLMNDTYLTEGSDRPSAGPVLDGSGVPSMASWSPTSRHSVIMTISAAACPARCRARPRPCSRKASRSRRSNSTTRECATTRCSPSSSATPACPICSRPTSTARSRPA